MYTVLGNIPLKILQATTPDITPNSIHFTGTKQFISQPKNSMLLFLNSTKLTTVYCRCLINILRISLMWSCYNIGNFNVMLHFTNQFLCTHYIHCIVDIITNSNLGSNKNVTPFVNEMFYSKLLFFLFMESLLFLQLKS